MFDYLIVGAGLFGVTCAYELTKKGKKCLVIDQRSHIGGNLYCEFRSGILIHKYGPHIFHTNSKRIWDYVNNIIEFTPYNHRVSAATKYGLHSFPINLHTFRSLFGIDNPLEAIEYLNKNRVSYNNPENLEEAALAALGGSLYELFIKDYSTKQWGRIPVELPASLFSRIPLKLTYDDHYHNTVYSGITDYTEFISRMLSGVEVVLNESYKETQHKRFAKQIVYSGEIDKYYDYIYGPLEYRTLDFEEYCYPETMQGCSQINYTSNNTKYTRSVEYNHFYRTVNEKSIIIYEAAREFTPNTSDIPYYPVPTLENMERYEKYKQISNEICFGGRLGSYRYLNMDQVIASAINLVSKLT